MSTTRPSILLPLLAVALVVGVTGASCLDPNNQPDSGVLEPYPDTNTLAVAGYVWDPEATQYAFGMCGPACSLRPLMMPGQPYFERALVGKAEVQLVDLEPGEIPYSTQSGDAGTWIMAGVLRRPEPYLYAVAWKERHSTPPAQDAGAGDAGRPDAGGGFDAGAPDAGPPDAGEVDAGEVDAGEVDAGEVDAGDVDAGDVDAGQPDAGQPDAGQPDAGRPDAGGGPSDAGGGPGDAGATDAGTPPPAGPFMGPIPQPTTYFPTVSITPPISPTLYQCIGRPAAAIGNAGILESVAKFLTNTGTPTVPEDFIDPAKYGGVIVWWAYSAGGATTRQGASGAAYTASAGRLIHVNWACPAGPGVTCPPGPPLPPPGRPSKSARNFFVMPGATTSNIGIAVVLLPPAGVAQTVDFTLTDTVDDPAKFRPYTFPELPSVTAIPGKIQFGQVQAVPQLAGHPAGYECLPEH